MKLLGMGIELRGKLARTICVHVSSRGCIFHYDNKQMLPDITPVICNEREFYSSRKMCDTQSAEAINMGAEYSTLEALRRPVNNIIRKIY